MNDVRSSLEDQAGLWVVGPVGPRTRLRVPELSDAGWARSLAEANEAAQRHSGALVQQTMPGFALPTGPEPMLLGVGHEPDGPILSLAAADPYLFGDRFGDHPALLVDGSPARLASASAVAEAVGSGSVLRLPHFGEAYPLARRLREHLERLTHLRAAVALVVLGPGTTSTILSTGNVNAIVPLAGAVRLLRSTGRPEQPTSLGLRQGAAWRGGAPLRIVGEEAWNATAVVSLDRPSGAVSTSAADDLTTDGAEAHARVRASHPPLPSASLVPEFSARALSRAGVGHRTQLAVRAVAPGGLILVDDAGEEPVFAVAGTVFRATMPGLTAVAMAASGPPLPLPELDAVLGTGVATDAFCRVATVAGWLEHCSAGDALV